MTLITVAAREYFVSLVTDRRALNSQTNEVYSENWQKHAVLNEDLVIANAGSYEQGKQIMDEAARLVAVDVSFDDLAERLKNIAIRNYSKDEHPSLKINIVLTGLDENNEVALATFDNKGEGHLSIIRPRGTETAIASTSQDGAITGNESMLNSLFFERRVSTPTDFQNAQTEFNDYIADYDHTVNKNHYCFLKDYR